MAVSRKLKLSVSSRKKYQAHTQSSARAESEIRPNLLKPKAAFSKDLPDGKVPYA